MTFISNANMNMFMPGMMNGGLNTSFLTGGCNNMFGSIFGIGGNNAFYNPCNGTYDYSAQAGYEVASFVANIGLGLLNQHISDKQAEKAQPSLEDQIAEVDAKIQEKADEIGVKPEEVANHKVEEKYTQAVTNANNALEGAKTQSQTLAGEINKLGSEIETLKSQIQTVPADADAAKKTEIENANKRINEEIVKKEAEKAKKTKEQAQLDKDIDGKLQTAVDNAIKAKEEREAKIQTVQTEVAKLQREKASLEEQKYQQDFRKAAKKADGNIVTRDRNFDVDTFDPKTSELGQPQLKALIAGFTNKKASEADKKKYATQLAALSQTQLSAIKADRNQEFIWKAAKEYIKNN